jgi:glycosyltransferase involved in cell wall biosynthesis
MAQDTLSLIIATYNRGPLIARTLDSAQRQTLPPAEIVVVDDCSSDSTGDWVRVHYPQVRVVRPDANRGTSGARNFGAEEARGEVLAFIDHDDELMPHALETLAGLLHDHPETRAAYADHVYNNTATGVYFPDHHSAQVAFARLHSIPVLRRSPAGRVYGKALHHAMLWGNLLQQPWAIYRDTFRALGGFAPDVRFCEDWDLYLRVTSTVPIVLSDEIISYHHIEGENLHLRAGQEEMHMRVLHRQLARADWHSFRARWVIRKRLANYHKTAGDLVCQSSLLEAWCHYLRSLRWWPFDHVVIARALGWPFRMLLGKN